MKVDSTNTKSYNLSPVYIQSPTFDRLDFNYYSLVMVLSFIEMRVV